MLGALPLLDRVNGGGGGGRRSPFSEDPELDLDLNPWPALLAPSPTVMLFVEGDGEDKPAFFAVVLALGDDKGVVPVLAPNLRELAGDFGEATGNRLDEVTAGGLGKLSLGLSDGAAADSSAGTSSFRAGFFSWELTAA